MTVRILEGDCRAQLRKLDSLSVQCVVTSPPYFGLRDYGTASWEGGDAGCDHMVVLGTTRGGPHSTLTGGQDVSAHKGQYGNTCGKCGARRIDAQIGLEPSVESYVETLASVFREVWRVLRDDGVLFLNLGDSYANKPVGSFNGGGFKDASAVSGSRNMSGVATSGNIDKLAASGLKPKDLIGIPWRVAFALQADGWWLRSDIIWAKPNPMPESVRDRPTKAHEYLFLLTKNSRYFWDAEAVKESAVKGDAGAGSRNYRVQGNGDTRVRDGQSEDERLNGRNIRSVWTIPTSPFPGAHFATFPPKLVEPCIKAGTSEKGACPACGAPWVRVVVRERLPGSERPDTTGAAKRLALGEMARTTPVGRTCGSVATETTGWQPSCACNAGDPSPCVVLDPFGGAGTVGLVADRLGRSAILIELNPQYAQMSRERIYDESPLFAAVTT